MFKLEQNIRIQEYPQAVWSFLSNLPVSQVCWPGRSSFQWVDSPKPAVGSRYVTETRFISVGYIQEGKITRWEPPDSFALAQWNHKHPRLGFTHQLRYRVEGIESRTQAAILHATVVGNYGPKFLELVFKEIYRRSLIGHIVLLKQAIEATDKSGRVTRHTTQRIAEVPAVGG